MRGRSARMPAAASNLSVRSPRSRPASLSWASEVFCQHLAQRRRVQHLLRQQLLEPAVLLLERLQAPRLRDLEPAVLRAPGVERRITDAVPPADLGPRQPRLVLLQHADDLLLAEPALAHRPSPSSDGLQFKPGALQGARSGPRQVGGN